MAVKQETKSTPERMEFISVYIGRETELDPYPCPDCGVPMATVWQKWQWELPENNLMVENTELIPYYWCQSCDPKGETTLLDTRLSLLLCRATLPLLNGTSKYRVLEEKIARLSEYYQERG